MNDMAASGSSHLAGESATPNPLGGPSILAVVGDRNLVFSEARQAIHELSDCAARVWQSLDRGVSEGGIVRELIGTGVDPDQAQSTVTATLAAVRTLRSATAAPSPISAPPERRTRLTILIAGVAIQVHLSKELVADVEAVFGLLTSDLRDADVLLCARIVGDTVNFCSPGQPEWSCERSYFIPLLKAQIIEGVLACAHYEVALHAAALVGDKDAVLLVGSPGAGKTTLAIALASRGFDVLADDVVLLDEEGLVTGVSLPFTAKSSAWPLLSHYWPGIVAGPSHCRPDGQTLSYIRHSPVADRRPRRIGLVVLLDRQEDAGTGVEELDLVCALSALVADGATRDQRLRSSGFMALVDGLRGARCYRLTYSDLMGAADAVRGMHA